MEVEWKKIEGFDNYSVSSTGDVRKDSNGRLVISNMNQYGVVSVRLTRNGIQHNRSVPLLVARTFVPQPNEAFDTPINLDGDRYNNHVYNLQWRPRWFAVHYNRQFREPYQYTIDAPVCNLDTGEEFPSSFVAAMHYGLLDRDLVMSITNRTFVWPTYHQFAVVQ